ncbi:Linoleate 13S-lipoxygenase 2-1, chloroplastic [Morella rubra]|uniref:Linoleate 13S-lipoxygenase 2-1, chloroplastic n=1 Tax=Morella rubra TaxID=262757 RepID=A0A6A1UVY3_9ROSI|nr:Linoleate 13S-lipoxygenase 2-1, chloroplastic [Morella rubra]
MMLKPQVSHSNTAETLFLLQKPIFSYGINGSASLPFWSKSVFRQSHKSLHTGFLLSNVIKAVASTSTSTAKAPEKSIGVKAIVIVKPTVRGFLSNLGLERGLDDIQDLLGKTLLELVSAELDPKDTIQAFAHKAGRRDEGVKYETDFKVPIGFGEVGAVLAENEQHREMFLQDIVLDGFPDGPVNVTCRSWVHSKFKNPEKRVFFTTKSYLPSQTPRGLRRLREEDLKNLRGNGQGERKSFKRIYDYDVYNDIGDPDQNLKLQRPVLAGKEHPYPRLAGRGARVV